MARSVRGDDDATRAIIASLRELSAGERNEVSADYALPSAGGTRWFHLQATRVDHAGQSWSPTPTSPPACSAERASAWQARHDHLTGLPNRAHLHELIDAELQRSDRPDVTVLFLDVDGFKDVNDSLGHEVGDDLLRQLAERLTGGTRAGTPSAGSGGDEFVVLCPDCDVDGAEAAGPAVPAAPSTGRSTSAAAPPG